MSQRVISDLERGINATARKDTAVLLAGALGLDGRARELFVAAARGRVPAGEALAAAGEWPGRGRQRRPWGDLYQYAQMNETTNETTQPCRPKPNA